MALTKELEEARAEIEKLKVLNADTEKDKLLADLRNTEKEWKQVVADLKEQKEQYANLIHQLVAFKDELCRKRRFFIEEISDLQ